VELIESFQHHEGNFLMRLRGFITKSSKDQFHTAVSFRSQADYDYRVPFKYRNALAVPLFPHSRQASSYRFPSKQHPCRLVACLYERCDLDWVPQSIVAHEFRDRKPWFRIQWMGLPDADCTWETMDSLQDSPDLVHRYCNQFPGTFNDTNLIFN
jgi:hypothetical protein